MALTIQQRGAMERRMRDVRYSIDSRDRTTISNALRVAAEQYHRDAQANAGTSLDAQFTLQADECLLIAELLEP